MKSLSRRTDFLRQSDIRAVTALVNEVDGINLGQGICDLPTPGPIKEGARRAIEEDRSVYSHYAGIPALKRAVLEKARRFNRLPAASEEEVMVSAGSTGAFVAAIFALLEPGDEVLLFEPFYGYHRSLIRLTGAEPRAVPMRGAAWAVDFDELRRLVTPRTKAILLNTPSNPCGKVWSRAELEALGEILRAHDLFAITDEIYEYMTYDGRAHVSLASLPGLYERTVTLSGFSKTYNMTGWRLGYAVGPAALLEKMGLLNDLFYVCAPTPLQHGVAEAFSMDEARYFAALAEAYARKREMMCRALEAAGFDAAPPQGAYYVMAGLGRLAGRPGFEDDRAACETLIRRTGVGSVPGSAFYERPEDGRRFLRFCFAKEFDVLADACERLVSGPGGQGRG